MTVSIGVVSLVVTVVACARAGAAPIRPATSAPTASSAVNIPVHRRSIPHRIVVLSFWTKLYQSRGTGRQEQRTLVSSPPLSVATCVLLETQPRTVFSRPRTPLLRTGRQDRE